MVSIDTEFSGLGDSKLIRQKNIQDRYSALKSTVQDHTLLALGLSIINKDECKIDNFHILMYSKDDFKISSSSIAFLAKNDFDFNYLFKHGIALDRKDRNQSLFKIWSSLFDKPIIVHNGWLDLMYLYSFLYNDLPNELGTFIADLEDMFKHGIYDTKYIADYEYREKASFLAYLFGKWERLSVDCPLKVQEAISIPMDPSNLLESKSKLPESKKKYCERYAAHGFCSSNACPHSHDLDVILECLENLPRLKKRKLEDTMEQDSKFTQVEHSACYDSYMTGYVFYNQIQDNKEILSSSKNRLYLIGKSIPLLIEKSRFSKLSEGHLKLKNLFLLGS